MHSLRQAALLALALSACTAIVRWIEQALGPQGVWWATLLAGFADAHAPSAALLTLAAEAPQRWPELLRAVLLVLSANTAFKCGLAFYSGGGRYGWATTVGLVAGLAAAWLSLAWS